MINKFLELYELCDIFGTFSKLKWMPVDNLIGAEFFFSCFMITFGCGDQAMPEQNKSMSTMPRR